MHKIINKIKISELNKNKKLILKNNKKNNIFIKTLIKLNIIKFIIKLKKNNIIILNFFKNNKLLFKLQNFFKKSNIKYVKCINLIKFKKNNCIILISNNKGLMTNKEAINNKIGGIITTIIWN